MGYELRVVSYKLCISCVPVASSMLSIVLPTYNEAENLADVLKSIASVLGGQSFEVIVVDDDSPDQTWEAAEKLKKKHPTLRVIRRIGRRGLASAVMEGLNGAAGDVLVVMDADLQHDAATILALTDAIDDGADVAIASRYIDGGHVGSWAMRRRLLSRAATVLARALSPLSTTDPLSGFFAMRREAYGKIAGNLRPAGFKILFEILAFLPRNSATVDVPLAFQERRHGRSKISLSVGAAFAGQSLRIACIRMQGWLFACACIAAMTILMPRVAALMPLYLDADARAEVQATLSEVAVDQGWLLSDLSLRAVLPDGIRVMHRRHHRGSDERECLVIRHEGRRISPCID